MKIHQKKKKKLKKKENLVDDNKDKKDKITTNELTKNITETDNISKDNIIVDAENKIIKEVQIKEDNFIKTQISNFEESLKLIKEKIEKIQTETDNNKNSIDSSKNEINQFKLLIERINNENKNNKIQIEERKPKDSKEDNDLGMLENKLLDMIEQNNKDFLSYKNNNNNKVNNLEEEIGKWKQEDEKIHNEIKKLMDKMKAIEEQIKYLPTMTIIKKIEEKIKIIEMEIEELGTKKDIQYICGELDKYEKEISKMKSFMVSQGETNDKYKDDINKIKNQFDTIKKTFSAISKLFENNSLSNVLNNLTELAQKIVDKEEYNKFNQYVNKTLNELKMDVNDHNRNLDEIMPLFRKILTMDDLNRLQDSLTGLIEKQNADANGKFADKKEIIKSIKSIESQVKIFMKNLDKEREKEKNESVILASKPVGGYKCASCEAYIGELKESYTYLPWNKYHGSERPYRLGSSFSRILQGLNLENTYNPFIHKNYMNANKKNYLLASNCLSVKKVKKIPPLARITSENDLIKNQTIEEHFSTDVSNTNKRYQSKTNLWGSKTIRTMGNNYNSWNKSKNNNNTSFHKNTPKKVEKLFKVSKKVVRSKINNTSEDIENHYYMPNL